jgi:diguanylate cyclase (GGDEF)-like protein
MDKLREIISLQNAILADGLNQMAVMRLVVERVPELLEPATGAVVEIRAGDEMVYCAGSGTAQHFAGLRVRLDSSLSGLCVRTGETLYAEDCETDDRVDHDACRTIGICSMICHPLLHHGQCVGVLKVFSDVPRAFDKEDIELVEIASSVIAAAIQHAAIFEEAFYESRSDSLSGLPNRRAFDEDLPSIVREARAKNIDLALIAFDLNDFKNINDVYGHVAGDEALRIFANVLASNIRASDRAFRLGGDEFAVLMPGCTAFAAGSLITRLMVALREPSLEHKLTFSYGIGQLRPDDSPATLWQRADTEMYRHKAVGETR